MKQLSQCDTLSVRFAMYALIGYTTGIASGMGSEVRKGLIQRVNSLAQLLDIAPIEMDDNEEPK